MRVVVAAEVKGLEHKGNVQVERIHFDGVSRTKRDALVAEVRELFSGTVCFEELVEKVYQTKMHMQHVGLFDAVGTIIDVDRKGTNPNGYELTFVVREPSRSKGGISMGLTQRGEGSTIMQYESGSALGRAEQLSAEYSFGLQKSKMFKLAFTKPFLGWQRYSGFRTYIMRNYAVFPWSGFGNLELGVGGEIYRRTRGYLTHQMGASGTWRQVSLLNNSTSFDIREFCGHSLKSSLFNILSYSTQDNDYFPTKGLLAKMTQEFAGGFMGGDVKFLKHEFVFKGTTPLPTGSYITLGLQGTHVIPRSGPTLHIADRSFIGGPHNLRGFAANGIGPVSDKDNLGGTTSWAAAAHIYHPILKKYLGNSLQLHGFAVTGNIHGVDAGANSADIARRLFQNPRSSIGAGLALKLGNVGRLELNYCVPFTSSYTDKLEPGIQIGIGTYFL